MVQYLSKFRSWWRSRRLEDQPVPKKDPVIHASLATQIAIWSLLLMATLLWALYEEAFGLRPWRDYQAEFAQLYRQALIKLRPQRASQEKSLYTSAGYEALSSQLQEVEEKIQPQLAEIEQEERILSQQLAAITKLFTTARSRIQAKIYEVETANPSAREGLQEDLKNLRKGPYGVLLPSKSGQGPTSASYNYEEFKQEFNSLKARQGQLQARKVELLRESGRLRRELTRYTRLRITGLTESQVDGLISRLNESPVEIKQIHNEEMNLVDRCESCHLGVRELVTLTAEDMGGKRAFVSHPNTRLFDIHDPEVFGCSPCHNGNGVGTTSIKRAHGLYKHWLWPLHTSENFEAGCLQCHESDRRLDMASVLNGGKGLYNNLGCWGCHPRVGFDVEPREIRENHKAITDLQVDREERDLRIQRMIAQADVVDSNEEANRLYAEARNLTMSLGDVDAELERLNALSHGLLQEVKKVGPNLKDVRLKHRSEWLPAWIKDPNAFRPTTKMPQFRLEDDQVQPIAAFIWQSGLQEQLESQRKGDPEAGQQLFKERGCMACHAIGEGDQAVGGTFAANLSRVGEKAKYAYLVRWIHNPRERTLPYCPIHQRDITPEDYASQGLPVKFDTENDQCPLGDHLLVVQNATVMPSLRLSWDEARDTASYLISLSNQETHYPDAPYLEDPELFQKGRFLVRHFGCAGCHEIAGLEAEGKIGTELTKEGSKPIERLDFALQTQRAKRGGWYNHKGFFERKLADPAIYDEGKIKEPLFRLRMPNFDLQPEEIDQLTTFLLGSVDSKVPEKFFHRPSDRRQDIQAGWWIVTKYNCVACHEFTPGQQTVLENLPPYQEVDGREKLPPSLVGQGSRVDPDWLARFLKNPTLNKTEVHTNGVRRYLQVRMPSFHLSDGEVQELVRFFSALAKQPLPYMPPDLEPLSSREMAMARELFSHPSAPCLRCHATGDPVGDRTATAPNFLLVKERLKPDWTERWIVHPEIIRPGTAMPSGLFQWDGERWVFALAQLDNFQDYPKDHADLVVRYMFQFTVEEQRRLKGMQPAAAPSGDS